MPTTQDVVMFDAVTRQHRPMAPAEQIAGSKLQISTDTGNAVTLGTDGGLKVVLIAQLPDNQIMSGDPAGTVALLFTPSVNPTDPTQTDYTLKADIKLTPVTPATPNQASIVGGALYVPPPATGGAAAVAIADDGTLPTKVHTNSGGTATTLLGTPAGWATISVGGVNKRIPYYD